MAVLKRASGKGGAAVVAALALVVLSVTDAPVGAQVLTQDQALALAFPSVDEIQRRTAYLDEAQLTRIRELAGPQVEVASSVVTYYVGLEAGAPVGAAYFDAHIVRTLDEVLMVVVGTDDRVQRVETVSFREPPEYRAPDGWLDLFDGRALAPELSLRREIPTMTGATLTSVAVTNAVRRVLSLHQVVAPFGARGADDR